MVYYSSDIVTYPNYRIMENISPDHPALMTTRLNKGEKHAHELVTAVMPEIISLSSKSSNNAYVFPLYIRSIRPGSVDTPNISEIFTGQTSNLTGLAFDARAASDRGDLKRTFGARDVFDWVYAALHSPTYRERYADFLKSDFARVPLPKDRGLFAELVPLGTKLVALHLLDADALPGLLTDPKVRFVSNGGEPCLGRFNKEVRRDASGRVYLNDQNWFATVPQVAWDHWIGGYQPAQKWLKDRSETGSKDKLKPGRLLTDEDILHYRRMIVVLEETGKVMAQIDEVIARHGGWPDAFKGMKD